MAFTPYFTATPIYNNCGLMLPATGTLGANFVPMHLTKLDAITTNPQLTQWAYGPIIDQGSNTAWGGSAQALAPSKLPKLLIEGWIDTPAVQTANLFLPNFFVDGYRTTLGELIAMYYEGRTNYYIANGGTYLQRVDPLWFRDPMGRVYNAPRLWAYTVTRLEAAPFRNNFTMTLQVK